MYRARKGAEREQKGYRKGSIGEEGRLFDDKDTNELPNDCLHVPGRDVEVVEGPLHVTDRPRAVHYQLQCFICALHTLLYLLIINSSFPPLPPSSLCPPLPPFLFRSSYHCFEEGSTQSDELLIVIQFTSILRSGTY